MEGTKFLVMKFCTFVSFVVFSMGSIQLSDVGVNLVFRLLVIYSAYWKITLTPNGKNRSLIL